MSASKPSAEERLLEMVARRPPSKWNTKWVSRWRNLARRTLRAAIRHELKLASERACVVYCKIDPTAMRWHGEPGAAAIRVAVMSRPKARPR